MDITYQLTVNHKLWLDTFSSDYPKDTTFMYYFLQSIYITVKFKQLT